MVPWATKDFLKHLQNPPPPLLLLPLCTFANGKFSLLYSWWFQWQLRNYTWVELFRCKCYGRMSFIKIIPKNFQSILLMFPKERYVISITPPYDFYSAFLIFSNFFTVLRFYLSTFSPNWKTLLFNSKSAKSVKLFVETYFSFLIDFPIFCKEQKEALYVVYEDFT